MVDDVGSAYAELTDGEAGRLMEPAVFGDLTIAFVAGPSGVRIELLEHR